VKQLFAFTQSVLTKGIIMAFNRHFSKLALVLSAFAGSMASAQPAQPHYRTYVVTITNGGAMPISPGALYASSGRKSVTEIGVQPSVGLIQLCQMGNPTTIISELKNNREVVGLTKTSGPVLPGQSALFEISFKNSGFESIHFVAMYGKTKDVCSTIDLQSPKIEQLRNGYAEIQGNDRVIATGAFTDPTVPANAEVLCANASDAVNCLRTLSTERMDKKQIRYFGGYLPSVLNFLEGRYGPEDALSLIVPTSGAVTYSLHYK
jgi:hypothetical protein